MDPSNIAQFPALLLSLQPSLSKPYLLSKRIALSNGAPNQPISWEVRFRSRLRNIYTAIKTSQTAAGGTESPKQDQENISLCLDLTTQVWRKPKLKPFCHLSQSRGLTLSLKSPSVIIKQCAVMGKSGSKPLLLVLFDFVYTIKYSLDQRERSNI